MISYIKVQPLLGELLTLWHPLPPSSELLFCW